MKFLLLFTLVLTVQVFGYVDMTDTFNRAKDLTMREGDYAFMMALSGSLMGSIFGLFLWKAL